MSLRSKLLFALSPLVVALTITGVAGSLATASLGQSSARILRDNFVSVLASQRMKDAVERIDSVANEVVAGRPDPGSPRLKQYRAQFEEQLVVEEHNLTEPGEPEAAKALRSRWTEYLSRFDKLQSLPRAAMADYYFSELVPALNDVRDGADTVLAMNQDAMVRKAADTERLAKRFNTVFVLVALAGFALGLYASSALTARLLRPLSVLGLAARRIGEGDLAARARVSGQDEIARVAAEFNAMADHLASYRRSSLGELLEAQSAAQAAIDSQPDPVVVVSMSGEIRQMNRAAETLLGIHPGPEGGTLANLPPPVRDVVQRVREHVAAGRGAYSPKSLDEAFRFPTPEGERQFLARGSPVHSTEGAVIAATVLFQDVTRLLRFDELKNDLVATVAHEFRTPLTSLRMAIHLCTEEAVGPLTTKQADVLFAAREDCERLQTIVDELLDLSRIQSGRFELRRAATSPEELVRNAVEAFRTKADDAHVRLEIDTYSDLGDVFADPDRTQLAFGNMLSNAIRHSPKNGAVVVRARATDGSVRFEVQDQGPGIPKEYQQAIFEKYFRMPNAPEGGAGLGLFIAREMVKAHGGELGVDSAPGKGSTFWFTLPTVKSVESRAQA